MGTSLVDGVELTQLMYNWYILHTILSDSARHFLLGYKNDNSAVTSYSMFV